MAKSSTPSTSPGVQDALRSLSANAEARARAAAGGADLMALIDHARATANELRILPLEISKLAGGDKAVLDIADGLRA
jgi:hypothetical protein